MLFWYLARLKEHGFLVATPLLLRVVWARISATLANRLLPARVECPCCGWEGGRFYDYLEVGCTARGVECPRCNSHPRHRAFAVWRRRDYGVDFLADIQRLPFAHDSFDLIWCQHVLTQIPDDRAAIREMRRVLRAGAGKLIVSAAQEERAETREFGRADKRHLGFWRVYGEDFAARLVEGGLEVRAVGHGLSADECRRYGIDSDEGFFICTKLASS